MRAGLGEVPPHRWLEQIETNLPETMADRPSGGHPFVRAVRGEVITGADSFCAARTVWRDLVRGHGRPLIDEKGMRQGGSW